MEDLTQHLRPVAESILRNMTTLHPDSMPRRRDRFIGRVRMAWQRRWWR